MNCHDARDWFSALLGGEIGLTEWALVETHVRQCPECRRELEQLQQVVRPRPHIAQPRALQVLEATRLGSRVPPTCLPSSACPWRSSSSCPCELRFR
jgi:predicted anti-sigma-YlaC factor YlaD